jgi:hypothetical protein
VEEPIEDRDPRTTAMLKGVLTATAEGTLAPERFTAEARAELFPSPVKRMQADLKMVGALKSFLLVERKDNDDKTRRYRYRATFTKDTMIFTVTLNPEGKIAGMRFFPE